MMDGLMKIRAIIFTIFLFSAFACGSNDSSRGDELYSQGNYQEAIQAYNEYIEYNPDDFKSIYNRGRTYEELGEYDKALQDYEAAYKINPKDENLLLSLGRYYFREENYEDAAFYFDKATQQNSNLKVAQFLKGRSFHKAGETDKAMEAYNAAISIDGQYGEAYLYRGALKIYLGRQSSGCNDLKTAQSLNVEEAESALKEYCN